MRKIAEHCNTETLHRGQICEFNGRPTDNDLYIDAPDIRLLVVFPHMKKSFDDEEVQRIWTNGIVVPSVHRHVHHMIRRHLPTSYELLRLNSQAQRVEAGLDVGDTPLCIAFGSENLQGTWDDIVDKTQLKGFEEFRGAFLVALGQWKPTATMADSLEGAWKPLLERWNHQMDMSYIPAETFEVRVESQYSLSG